MPGLSYLAITDHSRRLTVARGLDSRRLLRQMDEIDRHNRYFTILAHPSGWLIGERRHYAAHNDLRLGTWRLSPHPQPFSRREKGASCARQAGRFLGRQACALDMGAIVREAKHRGCFLEMDAQPDRLDLDDVYCRMARGEGVLLALDSDAHSRFELAFLDQGIGQARRGCLESRDVVNTRALPALRALLAGTMR